MATVPSVDLRQVVVSTVPLFDIPAIPRFKTYADEAEVAQTAVENSISDPTANGDMYSSMYSADAGAGGASMYAEQSESSMYAEQPVPSMYSQQGSSDAGGIYATDVTGNSSMYDDTSGAGALGGGLYGDTAGSMYSTGAPDEPTTSMYDVSNDGQAGTQSGFDFVADGAETDAGAGGAAATAGSGFDFVGGGSAEAPAPVSMYATEDSAAGASMYDVGGSDAGGGSSIYGGASEAAGTEGVADSGGGGGGFGFIGGGETSASAPAEAPMSARERARLRRAAAADTSFNFG
eukprot:COSAG01_NODE_18697_length_1059_cov_1.387500_1_plen_291_part_01